MAPTLQSILGPPATPPLYSLLSAALTPQSNERWQDGVRWLPEAFAAAGASCVNCGSMNTDEADEPIENRAMPIGLWSEDTCSTFGFEGRDYEGRARRQMASRESALIASELQLGVQRDDCPLDNVALKDGQTIAGSYPIVDALSMLEDRLARELGGRRAMIHCTPGQLTRLKAAFAIDFQGQRWVSALGSVIAADAGYGPDNGSEYLYGTSMVTVLRGPVEVPSTFNESIDRSTNTVRVFAVQEAIVLFDHSDQAPADKMFKINVVPASPA